MVQVSTSSKAGALVTLQKRMQRAAADPTTAARLALANATVLLRDDEDQQAGILLRFADEGMQVDAPGAGAQPDVCLQMPVDLLELFPFFHLAMAMAEGRVTYEGDAAAVREVIAVVPVLRTAVTP
jgi:hypothetical protein